MRYLWGVSHQSVFKRSRQGLLRFETVAFRQVQDWLIALLELLRNLRQLTAADVLAEGPVSFLNIRCRCHLGNTGAQTLFPATGAIPGYPRSTTKCYG